MECVGGGAGAGAGVRAADPDRFGCDGFSDIKNDNAVSSSGTKIRGNHGLHEGW